VFTVRYALSPYIKQTRFVFKGLISHFIPTGFGAQNAILTEYEKFQKHLLVVPSFNRGSIFTYSVAMSSYEASINRLYG
jgi:hypothetical protein